MNSVEFQPGGQTPEDCKNLCIKLEEAGIDLCDLSGGTFEGRYVKNEGRSHDIVQTVCVCEIVMSRLAHAFSSSKLTLFIVRSD